MVDVVKKADAPPADPQLAALAQQAVQLDQAGAPVVTDMDVSEANQPPASPIEKSTAAARFLLVATREALCFSFDVKSPARILTEARIDGAAKPIAEADVQTGGKLGALMDALGPWGACAIALAPLLAELVNGMRAELATRNPKPAAPAEPAAPTPAA